ncbi:hypothetical protein ACFFX1_33825 [Dactylosporangium sucinum]|uniref:hypothetical protein n=1 Tax=Dactylosporangium sucinum TaxID=1424081 RepID=UPI00167D9B66|nr:hypothetical protein [Dactylosporangium sucinum]
MEPVFVDGTGRRRRLFTVLGAALGVLVIAGALFQILLPLTAPLVDVYAVYGLAFLPLWQLAAVWCGFTALQVLAAAYALRLDREPATPLWTVPLQQVVYRQLLYLVVVQSSVAALLGGRQRWQAMARTGQAAALATAR